MVDFLRLLLTVVIVVPLGLVASGPALVLAALRGQQRVGSVVLNPGRRGCLSRFFAMLLGMTLWLGVWGSVAFLLAGAYLSVASEELSPAPAGSSPLVSPLIAPEAMSESTELGKHDAPTSSTLNTVSGGSRLVLSETVRMPDTATNMPKPTLAPSSTRIPSVVPATPTRTSSPTASATPTAAATATLSLTHTPSPSPTPIPTSTPTPTATATPAPNLLSPTAPAVAALPDQPTSVNVMPTLVSVLNQANQAIAAVEKANELLRLAVIQADEAHLRALEQYWMEPALTRARTFAISMHQTLGDPAEASYAYLIPPSASQTAPGQTVYVTSIEIWTYSGPRQTRTETNEYLYTLASRNNDWAIIDFVYRDVPKGLPTSTRSPSVSATPASADRPPG